MMLVELILNKDELDIGTYRYLIKEEQYNDFEIVCREVKEKFDNGELSDYLINEIEAELTHNHIDFIYQINDVEKRIVL